MKKKFLTNCSIAIAIGITASIIIKNKIQTPPKKIIGKNTVFHISSNYDGSKIALSIIKKNKKNKWDLYLSNENMNLFKFTPNPEITFEGDFQFGNENDIFFYTASQHKRFSLWKGNFSTGKSEKIFETKKKIIFPFMINNEKIYFISNNSATKNRVGWDWHSFSPSTGIAKITNNNYFYFKKPFLIKDSILGFSQEYTFAKLGNTEDPKIGKMYLETLTIQKENNSEKMLTALNKYISSENHQNEPAIQCDKNGEICIASKTIYTTDNFTFRHEFFTIESLKTKKLNTLLSWGESFTLSGNGKHLFLVGTHGARSEEYFIHKYSRNSNRDFVFTKEMRLSIK